MKARERRNIAADLRGLAKELEKEFSSDGAAELARARKMYDDEPYLKIGGSESHFPYCTGVLTSVIDGHWLVALKFAGALHRLAQEIYEVEDD